MAPRKVNPPATLPSDFSGWDKQDGPPQTLPADFNSWDQPTAPPVAAHPAVDMKVPSLLKDLQNSFDEETRTNPSNSLLQTGLQSVVKGAASPFVHPIETAKGLSDLIPADPDLPYSVSPAGKNPIVERGIEAYHDARDGGLGYSATKMGGEFLGNLALGEGAGAAARGLGTATTGLRDLAVGDPNASALRGLQIGPRSPKALSTLSAVEGARPFLQGARSLEDLQAKIPAAKNEIWAPYKQALESIGDKPTGFGSVADLEAQRLQNSALLRGLKSKNPEAIQLAMQKGLNEADLLNQEKQLKSLLDPELRSTGIDPTAIRKSFGEVSRIGKQVSGKSTLIEPDKPFGLGKITDIDIHKPLRAPAKIAEGLRDIAAGRPLFKGKATDVAIREGFRNSGPKPDLGRVLSEEEKTNPFINRSKYANTR